MVCISWIGHLRFEAFEENMYWAGTFWRFWFQIDLEEHIFYSAGPVRKSSKKIKSKITETVLNLISLSYESNE